MAAGTGWPVSSDRSFERLYRRHVDDVYRYALAVLANRSDAEDVTQTTFLNAYRSYRSGTLPSKPLNWLISIAHNVCRQRFRSAARRPSEVALDARLAAAADDHEDGFRAEDIRRALAALTFAQRSALAMRELEGRSYQEIAAVLQVSEGAVETLIFRARKAFREQLEGTLTCSEAELAISRQLDGALERAERSALRSHLRECEDCSVLARRFRAQQSALKRFVFVPLPQSLASFSGTGSGIAAGSAAVGAGLGAKVLALGSAAIVAVGVTTGEIVTHSGKHPAKAPPSRAQREASSVPQPAVVSTRAMPAVSASPVVAVRLVPAARDTSSSGLRGKRALHQKKHKPVAHRPHPKSPPAHRPHPKSPPAHRPHPKSPPAHVTEAPVVRHPALHGDVGHASTAPREHATREVKPKPGAAHHRKQITLAARRATHPTPKKQPDVGAPTSSKGNSSHGPPATVPTDPGTPSDQVHETGKPADSPTGPPESQGHEKEKSK
jgi:RNA polymerase sigma factor (sigma-70 family)